MRLRWLIALGVPALGVMCAVCLAACSPARPEAVSQPAPVQPTVVPPTAPLPTMPPTVTPPTAAPPTMPVATTPRPAVPPVKHTVAPTAAPVPLERKAPIEAWLDGLNSGDVDAALAPFSDQPRYGLGYDASGKDAVRGVFEWLVAIDTVVQLQDCSLVRDRVVCHLQWGDGCISAFKPEGLPMKARFTEVDGKLTQAIGAIEGNDWNVYFEEFIPGVEAWAKVNRPEAWAVWSAGADPPAAGAIIVKLCQGYAESMK